MDRRVTRTIAALAAIPWLASAACSSREVLSTSGKESASAPVAVLSAAPPPAIAATAPDAGASPRAAPEGMALVPAGPFTMGADSGGEPDEHPAHPVSLPAYYLDLAEVTNEAWNRCVAAGVCSPPDATSAGKNGFGGDARFRGPRQPVSAVAWDAARAYCVWLEKRLPTEAEWEKAARGTDARRYPWGNEEPAPDRAVFGGLGVTGDVGTHPRGDGPYGHHDLAGNVWEWVEDVYDPYAYTRPGAGEGTGSTCAEALAALDDLRQKGKKGFTGSNPLPTECERVLRGGAFNYAGPGLRSSNRVHHPARYRLVMSGFRCAADARSPGSAGKD
jgi:formylglycine-generating enzyme required for sulfatase activity